MDELIELLKDEERIVAIRLLERGHRVVEYQGPMDENLESRIAVVFRRRKEAVVFEPETPPLTNQIFG